MKQETLIYSYEGKQFRGHLVFDDSTLAKRPAVVVVHALFGLNAYAKERAEAMARLGYVGFAVDMYGEGKVAPSREEAKTWMIPLIEDKNVLRGRLLAAIEALRVLPIVDENKVCVTGYCFGGTCAIEIAKSGAKLSGAVSIHGVLGNPHKLSIKPVKTAEKISTPLLILHGYLDSYVSADDVRAFEEEMHRHGADWQFVTYGEAGHGFANPAANEPEHGLHYHEKSEKRSWKALVNFFDEVFR